MMSKRKHQETGKRSGANNQTVLRWRKIERTGVKTSDREKWRSEGKNTMGGEGEYFFLYYSLLINYTKKKATSKIHQSNCRMSIKLTNEKARNCVFTFWANWCKSRLKCKSEISRFLIGQIWSRDRNSITWLVEFANYQYREKITGKQKEREK